MFQTIVDRVPVAMVGLGAAWSVGGGVRMRGESEYKASQHFPGASEVSRLLGQTNLIQSRYITQENKENKMSIRFLTGKTQL